MKHNIIVETSNALNTSNPTTLNPNVPFTLHETTPPFTLITPATSTPIFQLSSELSSSPIPNTSIPTITPLKKSKNKGRTAGCKNYTDGNIDILLDLVEMHKPHGSLMWEKVAEEYNKQTQVK